MRLSCSRQLTIILLSSFHFHRPDSAAAARCRARLPSIVKGFSGFVRKEHFSDVCSQRRLSRCSQTSYGCSQHNIKYNIYNIPNIYI